MKEFVVIIIFEWKQHLFCVYVVRLTCLYTVHRQSLWGLSVRWCKISVPLWGPVLKSPECKTSCVSPHNISYMFDTLLHSTCPMSLWGLIKIAYFLLLLSFIVFNQMLVNLLTLYPFNNIATVKVVIFFMYF